MPDASDYIRTNQVGSQEDLEFTTAGGGPTIFIMRGSGEPSSSADTKAIVNYGYLVGNFVTRQQYFSGSQSSSLDSNSIFSHNLFALLSNTNDSLSPVNHKLFLLSKIIVSSNSSDKFNCL